MTTSITGIPIDDRTEFYASVEKEAKEHAESLSKILTIEEAKEYMEQLFQLNCLLRRQLQEQSALMKPICIFSSDELARRKNAKS